jgi:hypothetical protein
MCPWHAIIAVAAAAAAAPAGAGAGAVGCIASVVAWLLAAGMAVVRVQLEDLCTQAVQLAVVTMPVTVWVMTTCVNSLLSHPVVPQQPLCCPA